MTGSPSRASYADEPWFSQAQEFADQVREAREEAGFTQQQVGDLLGVNHSSVSQWERAHALPTETVVDRYVQFFTVKSDFKAMWILVRQRVLQFQRILRSQASQAQAITRDTMRRGAIFDISPVGYSESWWDPIVVDYTNTPDRTLDTIDGYWIFDWDYVESLKVFDADLLVVEEYEDYEPWGCVPRRLPAPNLLAEHWTPNPAALPRPSTDSERQAWSDWIREEQAIAQMEFRAEERRRAAFERAKQYRQIRQARERKEEMPKGFIKGDSITHQAYDLLKEAGATGLTATEVSQRLDVENLKTAAAMSELHAKGEAARLTERRIAPGKQRPGRVYVLAEFINGRDTEPYGRGAVKKAVAQAKVDKVQRKVHLKVSKAARKRLPADLRAEVENYQMECEVAGETPEIPSMPPAYTVPWTTVQRSIIEAFWQGFMDEDAALTSYLVSVADRYQD